MGDKFVSKSTSLLTDNSWIRKRDDEEEDINRDQNYGKALLSKSGDIVEGSATDDVNTTTARRTSTSVRDLTNRFGGVQDDTWTSPYSSNRNTSTSSKSTTTTRVTRNGTTETTVTTTQNVSSPTKTFTERVMSSSQGPQYSTYSPTRTSKVTDAPITSDKDAENKLYDTLIPSGIKDPSSSTISSSTRTTKVTETALISNKKPEDKFYTTDVSSVIKGILSPTDRIVSSSETVTVKSSPDSPGDYSLYSPSSSTRRTSSYSSFSDDIPTTHTTTYTYSTTPSDDLKTKSLTRTPSTPVDDLYGTLLPKGITSPLPSSDSSTSIRKTETVTLESGKRGDYSSYSPSSSTRRTSSYSSYSDEIPTTHTTSYTISTTPSYEYSSASSPAVFSPTTYKSSSMSDDILADQLSKSSRESVHATPERTVFEKDLCTSCRKPFNGDAKMVVDDLNIKCHATCFKCAVCNGTLGNLKAGDTLWIYRHMVHCENCFEVTRDKWRN